MTVYTREELASKLESPHKELMVHNPEVVLITTPTGRVNKVYLRMGVSEGRAYYKETTEFIVA